MKIVKTHTGKIYVDIDNKLEFLTVGDYGKENNIKACLATSTKREVAKKYLKMANVYDYFDDFTCGDEIENGKPAPDIFLKAASKVKTDIGQSLVLEDSINGLNAGIAAGAMVIMVPDTIEPTDEIRTKVDDVKADLDEVIDWISKENER